MINSSKDQVLSISGAAINPAKLPIGVKGSRWNYISYLPTVNYTVKEALAGYAALDGDIVKSQNQFAMYSAGLGWIGNLTYMEANKGYMLKRNGTGDVTFTYPAMLGSLSGAPGMKKVNGQNPASYFNNTYADNMSVVAIAKGIQPKDKILAYVNGELRGVSVAVNYQTETLQFITVNGDVNSRNIRFALERDGQTIANSSTHISYESNTMAGSLVKPLPIDFSIPANAIQVSPNPFTDRLNIEIETKDGDIVEIAVYDVLGRRVYQTPKVTVAGNHYSTVWNGVGTKSVCEAGVYLVHVIINGQTTVCKVEKTH